jgi:hypothetical protein
MACGTGGRPDRFADANRRGRSSVPLVMSATLPPPAPPAAAVALAPRSTASAAALIGPALAGAAVAVSLGVYGRTHEATFEPIFDLGFPSMQAMKAWLATGAFSLAAFQLLSALGMWGHVPFWRPTPRWLPAAHRWSGTAAFLMTLPVAYHCLWALGFQTDAGTRQIVHSILGCAFYGAFTTKLLSLRAKRLPGWALPVLGGSLVTILTALWFTSAFWFFTNVDFPALR